MRLIPLVESKIYSTENSEEPMRGDSKFLAADEVARVYPEPKRSTQFRFRRTFGRLWDDNKLSSMNGTCGIEFSRAFSAPSLLPPNPRHRPIASALGCFFRPFGPIAERRFISRSICHATAGRRSLGSDCSCRPHPFPRVGFFYFVTRSCRTVGKRAIYGDKEGWCASGTEKMDR
jgi:hypothetical protein